MNKKKYFLALLVAFLFILFQSGCRAIFSPKYPLQGTIIYLSFEGGFFGIAREDGVNYDPINLPDAFQKNGLRVKFDGKIRTDLASFHLWGVMFEISRIEKR